MSERQWRAIPGFENYEVSDTGVVRSKRGVLKPQICRNGYLNVYLYPDGWKGKRHCKGIHQLVLLAFVGEVPEGQESCHKDNNKRNNSLGNLRYGTKADNTKDRISAGNHVNQKLDAATVKLIRSSQETGRSVAKRLGISESLVSMVRNKKRWS